MTNNIYVLGGYQSDFSRNWSREGLGVFDLFKETLEQALLKSNLQAEQIDVAHVGNFVGELFTHQGMLNGFFAEVSPEFNGLPSSRHEAACASGSIAVLAAMRDIESGHYQTACVLGLEYMRNVPNKQAADNLAAAVWHGHEATDCQFAWPYLFNQIADAYEQRYGIDCDYLKGISSINFANAKLNPNAQTRDWQFLPASFSDDDEHNPVIEGRLRKQDCGQITDGATCVFLANERVAKEYAKQQGCQLSDLPRIKGWGHRASFLSLESKLAQTQSKDELLFPHVKQTFDDALHRAGFSEMRQLSGLETHDCFSITEYMAIDHCGLTPVGQSWQAVADGQIALDGAFPINPSGGLLGLGHPVGATGVRMLLDASKQVTQQAGDYQIANAENIATFNLGGSATTCVSFIVGVN